MPVEMQTQHADLKINRPMAKKAGAPNWGTELGTKLILFPSNKKGEVLRTIRAKRTLGEVQESIF